MRVNVYAEELTDRIELVNKTVDGKTFYGLRFWLKFPTNTWEIHRDGDNDSSSVTLWTTSVNELEDLFNTALQTIQAKASKYR